MAAPIELYYRLPRSCMMQARGSDDGDAAAAEGRCHAPRHKRFASRYHDLVAVSVEKSKALTRKDGFLLSHMPKAIHRKGSSTSCQAEAQAQAREQQEGDGKPRTSHAQHADEDPVMARSLHRSGLASTVPSLQRQNKSMDTLSTQSPSVTSSDTTPSSSSRGFSVSSPDSVSSMQIETEKEAARVETVSIAPSLDESDIDESVQLNIATTRSLGQGQKAQLVRIRSSQQSCESCATTPRRARASTVGRTSHSHKVGDDGERAHSRQASSQVASPVVAQFTWHRQPQPVQATSRAITVRGTPDYYNRPLPSLPPEAEASPPVSPLGTAAASYAQSHTSRPHSSRQGSVATMDPLPPPPPPHPPLSPRARAKRRGHTLWIRTDSRTEASFSSPNMASPHLYMRGPGGNTSRASLCSRGSGGDKRGSGLRCLLPTARWSHRGDEHHRQLSTRSPTMIPTLIRTERTFAQSVVDVGARRGSARSPMSQSPMSQSPLSHSHDHQSTDVAARLGGHHVGDDAAVTLPVIESAPASTRAPTPVSGLPSPLTRAPPLTSRRAPPGRKPSSPSISTATATRGSHARAQSGMRAPAGEQRKRAQSLADLALRTTSVPWPGALRGRWS